MSHMSPASWQPLHEHGVLLLEGRDAGSFLHGQVTADVASLAPGQATLAALCTPQGRVIATVRIGRMAQGLAVVLPRELAAAVAQRLRRFVLRARVSISDASSELAAAGLRGHEDAPGLPPAGCESLQLGAGRTLAIGPAAAFAAARDAATSAASWDALCVSLGEPEVYAATSEVWVPQMLNLDLLGAVSLSKGCYTGQEIVARTHYKGATKRRTLRYTADAPVLPGARVSAGERDVGEVLNVAGNELLAVVPLDSADADLSVDGIVLRREPLPYLQ